jgi:hypothetical protein
LTDGWVDGGVEGRGADLGFNIGSTYFQVKEFQLKRYNEINTQHYTMEIFPLETQTGKTNIFYIHSL